MIALFSYTNWQQDSNPLLKNVVLLHAMYCFMSRTVIFTKMSAEKATRSLMKPNMLPYETVLTSALISKQLQMEIGNLIEETVKRVLHGLEQVMFSKHNDNDSYALAFCAVAMLTLCIEAVQILTDAHAVSTICSGETLPGNKSRLDLCRESDEVFRFYVSFFHMVYKSRKVKADGRSGRGFNPFRDDIEVDEMAGLTMPMVELFKTIKQIVEDHGHASC